MELSHMFIHMRIGIPELRRMSIRMRIGKKFNAHRYIGKIIIFNAHRHKPTITLKSLKALDKV